MSIPQFTESEIQQVLNKITPSKSRASNNNLIFSPNQIAYSGNYKGMSLKRTSLRKCKFEEATFDHTSFTGSILSDVIFRKTCKRLDAVYFDYCILTCVTFESELEIENCSFTGSYLFDITFKNINFRSTHFDNSIMFNCKFINCVLRSTMFEGAYISHCSFIDCNMRNLNLEFATFDGNILTGSTISFFQVPYIIGIFKNITFDFFVGKNNESPIPMNDYLKSIKDSVIYFTSQNEYFPLVNLYFIQNNTAIAKECLDIGIDKALMSKDIRSVGNFCKIGQFYDILSISDINAVLKRTDTIIEREKDSSMVNILIQQAYQMRANIAQNRSKAKLEIVISTNLNENEFDSVGSFCKDLDRMIVSILPAGVNTSYQISHNSPFEIIMTCIGYVASIVTIAGPIYGIIKEKCTSNCKLSTSLDEYISPYKNMCCQMLNSHIDALNAQLANSKKADRNQIIESFRGKIIANANDAIDNCIKIVTSVKSH